MKVPSLEQIELAIVRYYNPREHIIMPNVIMFFGYEMDLLIIRKTNYAVEVEIKRSVQDTKKDLNKKHNHESDKVAELYYAIPQEIYESCLQYIPKKAGIFVIKKGHGSYYKAELVRKAKRNTNARKLTDKEVQKILRYSVYRIWTGKRKIIRLQK